MRLALRPDKGAGWLITVASSALLSVAVVACGSSAGSSQSRVATGPLRVSAHGAAVFRAPNTDNSLEEFGHEASRAELEHAAAAVHAYLAAWVEEDWSAACALGSSELHRVLERASELSPTTRRQGCIETIGEVAGGEPPLAKTSYEATNMDAESLREDGNFGYLFFYLGKRGYQQEVFREHGAWGVKAPLPSPLH